jgi:acyl carrier protein
VNADQILKGLVAVAREHLDYEGDLQTSSPLVEVLELDSIRLLTLIVEVENHFRVCLEEGDEKGLETAGDLVDLIGRRLANAG